MFKLDACFSGGSFKGGAIFIGGFKLFIALLLFFLLAVDIDLSYSEDIAIDDEFKNSGRTRLVTLIIVEAFEVLFAIILIIGALKSRTDLLTSWIVYTIGFCCLAILGFIVILSESHVSSRFVAEILIFGALNVYFLLIVNSLRLEIKEKRNQHIMVYKSMAPEPGKC